MSMSAIELVEVVDAGAPLSRQPGQHTSRAGTNIHRLDLGPLPLRRAVVDDEANGLNNPKPDQKIPSAKIASAYTARL